VRPLPNLINHLPINNKPITKRNFTLTLTIAPHIRGLIFDLDGTLINTMPLHYLAWQELLQHRDADFPEDLFYKLAGVPSDKIVDVLNETFGYDLNPARTATEKETLFLEKYLPRAEPVEPVLAIAREYKGRLRLAVATGGVLPVVRVALKAMKLENFFEAIVTSEDVARGKPAPDTFLEAARRLKVQPEYCLVFEDSDMGLQAADRAGMAAIDVRPWLQQS
jgi:beta-phosphoglucomutase family hydrolase